MKLKRILSVVLITTFIATQCSVIMAKNQENTLLNDSRQIEDEYNDENSIDASQYVTGVLPITDEKPQYIDEVVPRIVDVKLNSLAQKRLNNYYNEQNIPHLFAE